MQLTVEEEEEVWVLKGRAVLCDWEDEIGVVDLLP